MNGSCRRKTTRGQRPVEWGTLCATLMLVVGCSPSPPASVQTTRGDVVSAERALERGDWEAAQKLAVAASQDESVRARALVLAGQAAARGQQFSEAVDYWLQVDASDPDDFNLSRSLAAEVLFHFLGESSRAEQMFRDVLKQTPDYVLAIQGLATLLETEGRRAEMRPYLIAAIRGGEVNSRNLAILGWEAAAVEDESTLQRCTEQSPDDVWPRLGLAKISMRRQQFDQAIQHLQPLVAAFPNAAEAQALLGLARLRQSNMNGFCRWFHALPVAAHTDPEILSVLAIYASGKQNHEAAARCAWEALRRYPDHSEATYLLAQSLSALRRDAEAEPFATRHTLQTQLVEALGELRVNPENAAAIDAAAKLSDQLGHGWETWGWYQLGINLGIYDPSLSATLNELRKNLEAAGNVRSQQIHNPANNIDLSSLPLPVVPLPKTHETPVPQLALADTRKLGFRDEAATFGLDFQYDNGHSPQQEGMRMVESPGGGAAILDYDVDGWPDIYFPQGGRFEEPGPRGQDQCFRNLGPQGFVNVTQPATVGTIEFRHGCTVGDFNSDGFPDLYVTGPGTNRLFENLGDGTFEDVTAAAGLSSTLWTTSCVMADLNQDGHPDIYDVNYLTGDHIYLKQCGSDGHPRVCHPAEFAAASDELWLSDGQGNFLNATAASGVAQPNGKGLGIVAADLTESGRLSLFIANDTVPNFLFLNTGATTSSQAIFQEAGLLSGVSVNSQGFPQASMGIAAGDGDGDGSLDLLVTNFHRESNTFYRRVPSAGIEETFFEDASYPFGLVEPSIHKLGFGTQFLDADLDGDLDLLVTNGDIDDFTFLDRPFQQPTQLFINESNRFIESPPEQAGTFFSKRLLGRGLVRLDWNRDGREDAIISFLDHPAALLTNTCPSESHAIQIHFVGTQSARDPIGVSMTTTTTHGTATRQLTAGDGYLTSNQRQLVVHLSEPQQSARVDIRWPSGTRQSFASILPGAYIAVEGNQHLFPTTQP